MLCQVCKKNAASVFLKVAVNNKMTEMHLCERCAAGKGASFAGFDVEPFNISGMTGNLSGYFKEFLPREKRTLHCRSCGLAYHEFKEAGFLGCPECYSSFEPQLTELLTRIHGNCGHTGKNCGASIVHPVVNGASPAARRSVSELKAALKKAVETEDFESAARLRDRIRELGENHG